MMHSRTSVALTVLLGAALSAGCSSESEPASVGPAPVEAPLSEVGATESESAQEANSGATGPAPRLVKADVVAPRAEGTNAAQDAQLAEMRKPYTHLSAGEAGYFEGKFLNTKALGEVLRSPDFASKVLDLQSGGDVNSMARQRSYTDVIKRSLQPYADRARFEQLGCGTMLCMGSIRTSSKEWIAPWTIELHNQPLPLPSFSVQPIRRGAEYEVRFSFTTAGAGGISNGK